MTTIVRLLIKGSRLLNRLREQQTANRAGQSQREQDKKTQEKQRKRKQEQQPVSAFAPELQRRKPEPIAVSRQAKDWYFVVVNTYRKPADYKYSSPGFVEEAVFDVHNDITNLPTSPVGKAAQIVIPPVGVFGSYSEIDGRTPINGGLLQRLYLPFRAKHPTSSTMSVTISQFKLPSPLTTAGADVNSLSAPSAYTVKTISADTQANQISYYARLKFAYGFAVGYTDSAIEIDGGNNVSTDFSANKRVLQVATPITGQVLDRPNTEVQFNVGDNVRIWPQLYYRVPNGYTEAEITQLNNFMIQYWYNDAARVYTITEVDNETAGQTRYTINNAAWPKVTLSGLNFYVMRQCDDWASVGQDEFKWVKDFGVPLADELQLPVSDLDWYSDQFVIGMYTRLVEAGKLTIYLNTGAARYTETRLYTNAPIGLTYKVRSSQDVTDAFNDPETFQTHVFTITNGTDTRGRTFSTYYEPGPDGNDHWRVSSSSYNSESEIYTFNFQERRGTPEQYPPHPVRVSKTLFRSILRPDLGTIREPSPYRTQPDYDYVFIVPGK